MRHVPRIPKNSFALSAVILSLGGCCCGPSPTNDSGVLDATSSETATDTGTSPDSGGADVAPDSDPCAPRTNETCVAGETTCTNGIVSACFPTASCATCCQRFTAGSGTCQ